MSRWSAAKAGRVLAALLRIGWGINGHWFSPHAATRRLADYVFAFHDGDEIGPRMLARIAKQTGLHEDDL